MPSSSTPEVGDVIVDVELLLCVCFVILLRNFNMEKFLIKRPRFQNKTEATVYILLGRVALGAQRPIVIKLSRVQSVGRSVCPVHCGKTTDRIRQLFGTIGRTGPRMRQVLRFANRSTGRGTFGGEFGPHHCNQWGLYVVRVRQCLNRRRCGLGLSLIHI